MSAFGSSHAPSWLSNLEYKGDMFALSHPHTPDSNPKIYRVALEIQFLLLIIFLAIRKYTHSQSEECSDTTATMELLISPRIFLTDSLVLPPVLIFLTLCYLTLSVDMITFQNLNNIFHLATITLDLCHICVFVHPSLHVCVTLVILGSMHGDPGCKAISSLLFLPLNPFSSLCWVCYWKGFLQEGLSWKLADSRLDS